VTRQSTTPDDSDGGDGGGAAFTLPGVPPMRDTLDGWQQYCAAYGTFVPAPHLDLATWQAMPARQRTLRDLHRAATHANLPLQETPMSQAVATLVRGRIDSNALKRKPTTRAGVIVTGGGNQGKTETVCAIAAAFETGWRMLHAHIHPGTLAGVRDRWAPVAYAQTPVTAKPKSLCKAILNFYGAPTKGMDLPDLVAQVAASLTDHGTKVLILDDISRLRMHRADDQDVLDLLRAFMSMHVTLVLIGVDVPGSGLLHEGRPGGHLGQRLLPGLPPAQVRGLEATQTQRRFDLIELGPFRYDTPAQITAWTQHLAGIETQLRLMNATPGMLTDATMPEYLFRRTNGVVGLLERLIEDGCGHAIAAGVERLTQTLLDGVVLNTAGNDTAAGKSPRAAAQPDQPARPGQPEEPPGKGKRRRGRNTAFDDNGQAGETPA
jgi:hypothetical protein